jgi:hypothetical protein
VQFCLLQDFNLRLIKTSEDLLLGLHGLLIEYYGETKKVELTAFPQFFDFFAHLARHAIHLIEVRQASPHILLELDLFYLLKDAVLASPALVDGLDQLTLLL